MVFLKANGYGPHTIWYLAHNHWVDGRTRTEYLRKLGALTPAQVAQYRKFLALLDQGPDAVARATEEFQKAKPFDQRRHGVPATVHALFDKLGFRRILLDCFAGIPNKLFRAKLVETMAANRLDDPRSNLALAESWYGRTSLPFLLNLPAGTFDEDDLYETLDVLGARQEKIERRLYEAWTRTRSKGLPVVMKDLTSTYTEGEGADRSLWAHGYSRDRRPDRRQVNWSLVVTPEGLPITLEVYKGNTKDETTVAGTIDRLKRVFGVKEAVFVGDRGMLTTKNLERLHAAKFHYVVAETLSHEKEILEEARSKGRKARAKKGHLSESFCEVVGVDGRRHIAVFSRAKEKEELETLADKLRKGKELELWAQEGVERGDRWWEGTHHELVRSLTKKLMAVGAEGLFQVVWDPSRKGSIFLEVNEERRRWEEERAGWWMLTTDTELSGDAVIDLYQGLAVVEHAFRELKSPLKTRPVYHWKAERVKAHLFLCVLSYWLARWIELEGRSKGWKVTVEEALDELRAIHLDELGVPGVSARWWAVKELVGAELSIVNALGIAREVSDLPKGLVLV
ncbi:MAG: IS1634 family transposase [Thermoplasmata archaeon]